MDSSEGSRALSWRSPLPPAGSRCVFIDRDGVLNERIADGYVLAWHDFRFRPDAFAAMEALAKANLPVVVVSNQSCVGRGLLAQRDLEQIMERMRAHLEGRGTPLYAWYCCPHAPDAGCDCRKPKPGMLRRSARESGFDLGRSYMIGDTDSDVAAGAAAGSTPILIDPALPTSFVTAARQIVTAKKV